jgi:hypothetical protein
MFADPTIKDFRQSIHWLINEVGLSPACAVGSKWAERSADLTSPQIVLELREYFDATVEIVLRELQRAVAQRKLPPQELRQCAYNVLARFVENFLFFALLPYRRALLDRARRQNELEYARECARQGRAASPPPLLMDTDFLPDIEKGTLPYFQARLDHKLRQFDVGFFVPHDPEVSQMKQPSIAIGDNSVVGQINTGIVGQNNVINQHHDAVLDKARDAIEALRQSVAHSQDLTSEQKNDLMDQIAFLSSQATSNATERKPGMIKLAFRSIAEVAAGIKTIADA